MSFNDTKSLKALGMSWETSTDCFFFNIAKNILESKDCETKRSLLSLASKIFDPMGLLSPYVLRAKMMFQELWSRGLQWDDKLPSDILSQWRSWKTELSDISDIKIPRCFTANTGTPERIEIHGFGDASPKAYGAAVYVRTVDMNGHINTKLVMSKSRVAPLKRVTLPRLELLASVINARLVSFVAESMKREISQVVLWADSTIALYWIKGLSYKWKPFVANRVEEIQLKFSPYQWRYCPGKENPADCLTRGLTCKDLHQTEKWWTGPSWLSLPSEEWPSNIAADETVANLACKESRNTVQILTTIELKEVIDPERHGSWLKLIRVTAIVFRAVQLFKKIAKHPKPEQPWQDLSVEELQEAEMYWYRRVQSATYKEELQALSNGRQISRSNRILMLDPIYDSRKKVMRVGRRLQDSNLPEEAKHQVILPHGHLIVEKIMQVHHQSVCAGPSTTLSVLRQKIWITQGLRDVKRVIQNCRRCRQQHAAACSQKMGNLPKERVQSSFAFSHVGVDFAGPLYTRTKNDIQKAYICLFTCASSHMTHLELTDSLNTDDFLQAFRRMINRRGLCQSMQSDNAKTFKAADRTLQQLFASSKIKRMKHIDQNRVAKELASLGIKWKFITERSPWRGGWWERIVKSVKVPLKKVLGNALLSSTELYTILTDIEAMINSRPLTYVGDDTRDPEPITPAHLAIGRALRSIPSGSIKKEDRGHIIQRFLYHQRLLNHFWKRWRQEYLQKLSIRNKWKVEQPSIEIGDVVLISDDNVQRGKWPMGRIIKVHPGSDGLIRTATLQTQRGELRHPVQRLRRLEIEHNHVDRELEQVLPTQTPNVLVPPET